jgi:hypothetical protein
VALALASALATGLTAAFLAAFLGAITVSNIYAQKQEEKVSFFVNITMKM